MPQILIRAHKNPFNVADADTTYRQNLIGNNTGNLVFSQAVYRLLSTAEADLETSGLAKSHPRVINSRFDHVVIPLANAFRPTYLETLDALSNLMEQLTIPVTVLGVGEQASLSGVYKGADNRVKAGFLSDLHLAVPRGMGDKLKATVESMQPLLAPINTGQRVGTLKLSVDGQPFREIPVVALEDVGPAGIFGRGWDTLRLMFR